MKKLNSNLANLIAILNDCQFHDGTEIGKILGITRSAVWKAIQKLNNYGLEIQSAKNKGYALAQPLFLLDAEKIRYGLAEHLKQQVEITIFETIHSTNTYLKNTPPTKSIAVCLAEQQTQGKGRFSRYWHSPFAQNIYFSCRYRFLKDISELAGFSSVIGLAVINTLKEFGVTDKIFIKWPNDILWDQKKLAGVLIEINTETDGVCSLIVGIGVNVNMQTADTTSISQAWTSVQNILQQTMDRNALTAALINNVIRYTQQFENSGLPFFNEEWQKYDYLYGQPTTITANNAEFSGVAQGINHLGHLMLQVQDSVQAFSSGNASIKKT